MQVLEQPERVVNWLAALATSPNVPGAVGTVRDDVNVQPPPL